MQFLSWIPRNIVSLSNNAIIDSGGYISENSILNHLPNWAYLEQKSDQNTVNEWFEHQTKVVF